MKNIVKIVMVILVIGLGWYFISPLLITKTVNEDLPYIPSELELEQMSQEDRDAIQAEIENAYEDMEDIVIDEEMDSGMSPSIIKTGNFRDVDNFHKGSGLANLYTNFLRLDNFQVTNGPDLRVLLVEHPNPQSPSDLGDYLELGALKGNVGNQNYEIPSSADVGKYKSVVIYCKPFKVLFSVASLN